MADNRNAGWRGRYGWGETSGARGGFGEERYSPEMWDRGGAYDADSILQGGYREGGSLQGGPGRAYRGREMDDYGRGYGVEWSEDQGYDRAARRNQAGEGYGDRSYDGGSNAPYGRRQRRDGYYGGDVGGDYGRGRRPGERRSFMQHNDYVEAVTDGADTPGEHRGRGPKGYRRSDERIREDINDRLTDDSWLDASNIEVAVEGGEVTLSGSVDSRQAKRRAEDLAERVSGVEDVQNNIKVSRSPDINDQTAASSIAGPTI